MAKIVEIDKYRPRIIDKKIDEYLDEFGAIFIRGPRRCGKSWTASYHSNSEFLLQSPDQNFNARHLAEEDVGSILKGATPRLIDEWQDVPTIWDAVRTEVDRRAENGQFILTGSAFPKNLKTYHSGIGRIARLRMRTMSLYETGDSTGEVSLEDLCNGKLTSFCADEHTSLEQLAYFLIRGGWPRSVQNYRNPGMAAAEYINQIIEVDSQEVDGTKYSKKKIELLLQSLARNESTLASAKLLLTDTSNLPNVDGIDDKHTVLKYLDFLDRTYITENLPPYYPDLRSGVRVTQAEKRHFCDVSLACALLKATPEKLMNDVNTFGFLFESLCEHDLRIYAESFGGEIYHYRDYRDREVDAVIEMPDGKWCAFEIKLGVGQIQSASDGLVKFRDDIEKNKGTPPSVLCVISGTVQGAYTDKNGVFVVPFTTLKP